MTASAYSPDGKTLEHRLQSILRRREQWLIAHPEASSCTILVHPNAMHSIGFWLKQHGAEVATLPRGGPALADVWLVDGADVEVSP